MHGPSQLVTYPYTFQEKKRRGTAGIGQTRISHAYLEYVPPVISNTFVLPLKYPPGYYIVEGETGYSVLICIRQLLENSHNCEGLR
jgi:hypothetical protein